MHINEWLQSSWHFPELKSKDNKILCKQITKLKRQETGRVKEGKCRHKIKVSIPSMFLFWCTMHQNRPECAKIHLIQTEKRLWSISKWHRQMTWSNNWSMHHYHTILKQAVFTFVENNHLSLNRINRCIAISINDKACPASPSWYTEISPWTCTIMA